MPVNGHPELLARLREAESYLLRRFAITDPKELAGRLGVHQIQDIRPAGNGMHTLGMAWMWTVTALSRAGLGRTVGGRPDFGGHRCNYDLTEWEFAYPCPDPEAPED